MRFVELRETDEVVVDIGHTGRVTGLAVVGELVVSGATDGYVNVREESGRSTVPPLHLREITTVLALPDSTTCIVGTVGLAHGFDVTTGKHAPIEELGDTVVTCSASNGTAAWVGCADGSVRSVSLDEGVAEVAQLGQPVEWLDADGDLLVAVTVDGHVTILENQQPRATIPAPDGTVVGIACLGDGLFLGVNQMGKETPDRAAMTVSEIRAHDADGALIATGGIDVAMTAMLMDDYGVIAAFEDGTVRDFTDDLEGGGTVLTRRSTFGIHALLSHDLDLWVGTDEGHVVRVDPEAELPSIASGVVGLGLDARGRSAVSVDGQHLFIHDLRTGARRDGPAVTGAIAVTFVDGSSEAVVIAFGDGRLERRQGPDFTETTASAQLPFRPSVLGWCHGRIVAESEDAIAGLDATSMEAVELTSRDHASSTVARRVGHHFRASGELAGMHVTVLDRLDLVVIRPGLLGVTAGAVPHVRIWRDGEFHELPPA